MSACVVPPVVGMSCNYSTDGVKQFPAVVNAVYSGTGFHVDLTYQDNGSHNVSNVYYSGCCVSNAWGCAGDSMCINGWRVLSDRRAKVPA